MRIHLGIFLLLIFATTAGAQSFYSLRTDRSVVGIIGVNSSTYYGDLKDYADVIDARPSISLGAMSSVSRTISIRSEFSWIRLSGTDLPESGTGRNNRNLSFFSNNFELNVTGVINAIPLRGKFYQRSNFNLYGLLGLGVLYFNPKATLDGVDYALQPLRTEGVSYSRFALVIPYGFGGKIKLTPKLNLALEAGWRKTFTDYLDDVSTVHIDQASISNPITRRLTDRRPEVNVPIAKAGTARGNPDEKDGYMLTSVRLEYYLPVQMGPDRRIYNRKRRAAWR